MNGAQEQMEKIMSHETLYLMEGDFGRRGHIIVMGLGLAVRSELYYFQWESITLWKTQKKVSLIII